VLLVVAHRHRAAWVEGHAVICSYYCDNCGLLFRCDDSKERGGEPCACPECFRDARPMKDRSHVMELFTPRGPKGGIRL
jgi:hypothetical protein